jgi:hypothetical protein
VLTDDRPIVTLATFPSAKTVAVANSRPVFGSGTVSALRDKTTCCCFRVWVRAKGQENE